MSNLKDLGSSSAYKAIHYFFLFICTLATICFICYCLYQYSLNEDVSQVTFKEFHQTEKDIYPSLTLCFGQFFFYDENKYGSNFTDEYSSYLTGDYWDDQMLQVDYDEVTFDINEYLLGLVMYTTDWRHINEEEYFGYDHTVYTKSSVNTSEEDIWPDGQVPKFNTSYRGPSQKCWTVDIPYMPRKNVWTFSAIFDSSIFPNGVRPGFYDFGVKVHYPGQLIRHQMQKYIWKDRDANSSDWLTMRFKMQKVEVIRNRETAKQSCNVNWTNDDESIMLEKIKTVGCKPSYWKVDTEIPTCTSQKEMKMFAAFNTSHYKPPCKSIQNILYSYEEKESLEDLAFGWGNDADKIFQVLLQFTDGTYMEIQQVRGYGLGDAVGDIGGYLGLFLGFALLQIPEMLVTVMTWIGNLLDKRSRQVKPEIIEVQENDNNCCHGQGYRECIREIKAIRHDLEEIKFKLL